MACSSSYTSFGPCGIWNYDSIISSGTKTLQINRQLTYRFNAIRDGHIVLDIDSIRIKEDSSDLYSDSRKKQMLDEIISLAENNGIHLETSDEDYSLYLYHNDWDFIALEPVDE